MTKMDENQAVLKVLEVNSDFYNAFENLSIERMETLWKHDDNIVCIHPGWDLFIGWLAIRESWMTIFHNTEMIRFIITNTKIRIFEDISVVVCLENIETSVSRQTVRFGVTATNIFEHSNENKKWLLIHHHGSSVSNYLAPNISV
ncbi:MAG: nuclear transport factor 2 family protein [Nitrososphaeraceae archaeon]|jgi:SnoaL-like domain